MIRGALSRSVRTSGAPAPAFPMRASPRTALAGDPLPPPPASSHIPGGRLLSHPTIRATKGNAQCRPPSHDPTIERDACGIGPPTRAGARRASWSTGRWPVSRRSRTAGRGPPTASRGTVPGCLRCTSADRRARRGRRDVLPARALAGHRRGGVSHGGPRALGWRDVPLDVAALGSTATASMPRIAQLGLPVPHRTRSSARTAPAAGRSAWTASTWRRSRSARSRTRRSAPRRSFELHPDLADPGWALCGRSSTSGSRRTPRRAGERAQPFRLLGHNGEINTIDGNVEWMEARERASPTPISRRRSIAPGRTRRSSTTRSSSS